MTTNYKRYKPGSTVRMHIAVPQELRELCIERADELGVSLQQFCLAALREYSRDTIGLPKPPPAKVPPPSVTDVLRAYVDGETKLIGPCGSKWPCLLNDEGTEELGDWEFCKACGIRVQ
jgi:hypothetical protein